MSETIITAQLTLTTGLHVGTGKWGMAADAPVRRTGDGRLHIPGRALGGSLRTLATRLAPSLGFDACHALLPKAKRPKGVVCNCTVCQLFGTFDFQNDEDKGQASALWVYDAFAENDTHIRDGVGIDRASGTAARNVKFDYEVVPANTTFQLQLRLHPLPSQAENEHQLQPMEKLLMATLAEWGVGHGSLGGNVARGLGRFKIEGLKVLKTQLETADQLIDYLLDRQSNTYQSNVTATWRKKLDNLSLAPLKDTALAAARGFVTITFTLQFKDFFLTNDPLVAMISGFDHAPLVDLISKAQSGVRQPVLSGSSLRGVLRTHAEKIARTLVTHQIMAETSGLPAEERPGKAEERFLQICPACDVLKGRKDKPLASCDARLDREEDRGVDETPLEALCLSCRLFGSQRRGSRLWVRDATFTAQQLDENDWKAQDFLAIDRFTGGGKEGAKFDAAPLLKARFEAQLTLHEPQPWELGWLALVLRDLAEGYLTVGFGAAKGYGHVKAQDFVWKVGYLNAENTPFDASLLTEAEQEGVYEVVEETAADWMPSQWQAAAKTWVADFHTKLTTFTNDGEQDDEIRWQAFNSDTYFGTEAETLYPVNPEVTNE